MKKQRTITFCFILSEQLQLVPRLASHSMTVPVSPRLLSVQQTFGVLWLYFGISIALGSKAPAPEPILGIVPGSPILVDLRGAALSQGPGRD